MASNQGTAYGVLMCSEQPEGYGLGIVGFLAMGHKGAEMLKKTYSM